MIEQNIHWTEHTYQTLQTLEGINTAMLSKESAVRGYLVSGNDKFLEPYKLSEENFQKNFASVKELTSDNPAQQARLVALKRAADKWSNEVAAKEIALGASGHLEGAQSIAASGAGKAAMDEMLAVSGEMAKVERDLLETRRADQRKAFDTAYVTSIAGSIASVVIAILLTIAVFGLIVRPLARLVAVLRRMAQGRSTPRSPRRGAGTRSGRWARRWRASRPWSPGRRPSRPR